jgi:flavodoxin I
VSSQCSSDSSVIFHEYHHKTKHIRPDLTMRLVYLFYALVGCQAFSIKPVGRPLTSLEAKIGLFFGTSTGSTEDAADMIAKQFLPGAVEGPIDIDSVQGSIAAEFSKHDALIVGTPTWNTGAETERSGTGWDEIYYGEMQNLELMGKKVAVFGLGDSVSYSENYADASGELHDVFESLGCKMMGYTSQEGYEHDASKAIRGDLFCGLLLDAVNQEDLTEERIKNWVVQLLEEGILEGSAVAPTITAPAVTVDVAINGSDNNAVSNLEQVENAKSNLLTDNGFTPHFNPRTQRTMWTSRDGHTCYFTDNT